MLPAAWPILTDTSLLDQIPCPPWHITLVSDPQAVRSQAVPPSRADPLVPIGPMLAPFNVTLVDPVPPLFDLLKALADPLSAENGDDALPTLLPAVKTALRLPDTTCPTWQRTDESESHTVPSHPVFPTRTAPVLLQRPTPAPCRDTLMDPVDARLSARI